MPKKTANPIWIVDFLKLLGTIQTSSEAKRLFEAGAVAIDDQKINYFKAQL